MKCGTLSLLLGAALLAGAPSVFCGDAAGKNAGDRIFLADLSGKTPLAAQWQVKANLKVENGELTLKGTVADPKVTLPEEYRIRFSGKIKEEDEQVKGGFLTVSLDQKVTVLVRLGARGPSQILHPDPQNPKRNTGATRKTRIQLNETFQCEVCRRKAGDLDACHNSLRIAEDGAQCFRRAFMTAQKLPRVQDMLRLLEHLFG